MHLLKFIEASAIRAVQLQDANVQSPSCQRCLKMFQENLQLVIGQAATPGWASLATTQWAEACTKAARHVFGDDFHEKIGNGTSEQNRRHWILSNELMGAIVAETQDEVLHQKLEHCTRTLEQIVMSSGTFVHGIFEGALKSLCIQSWTAIEVLFEELHGSVIDTHPNCFPADILEMRARTKSAAKGKKFHFRRREAFRESYDLAFMHCRSINMCIQNESLDALALVRNLLVHKGGIVDQSFLDDLPQFPVLSKFPVIQKDQPLQFDGEIVRELVDAAISKGYELIQAVDAWLLNMHLSTVK